MNWMYLTLGILLFLFITAIVIAALLAGARKAKPHSKRMEAEQKHIDKKERDIRGEEGAEGSRIAAEERFMSTGWKIFFAIVGILVLVMLFYLGKMFVIPWFSSLSSASPAAVAFWERRHWILIITMLIVLFGLGASPWFKEYKRMLDGSAWVIFVLALGIPLFAWIDGQFGSSCTGGHPCGYEIADDGSTTANDVPNGQTACFEPWLWDHLPQVGLMISYRGSPTEAFPCSREQVFAGKCYARYDRFWFKPPRKTRLPDYWFVRSGTPQC